MPAQILQFPTPAIPQAATGTDPVQRTNLSTRAQARRIVAQIEREIAAQAQKHFIATPLRFTTPPPVVVAMETPATVGRRILNALRAFIRRA